MRRSSYFRRIAGVAEIQTLSPPRSLFTSFPSVTESAGTPEISERDAIRQPVVTSKIRPVTTVAEAPSQPQPAQMPSSTTTTTRSLPMPAAPGSNPALQSVQNHSNPEMAAQSPAQPRQPAFQTTKAIGTPTTIEPSGRPRLVDPLGRATSINSPLAAASAPETLSGPTQSDSPSVAAQLPVQPRQPASHAAKALRTPMRIEPLRRQKLTEPLGTVASINPPLEAVAVPKNLSGPMPSDSTKVVSKPLAEKTGASKPAVRPLPAPIRIAPQALEQVGSAVESTTQFRGVPGGTIHIGSLEVKITPPPPPPPPMQAPPPIPRKSAVSSKPISREFATFGIAQAY